MKRSKKYQVAIKKVDSKKQYTLEEAMKLMPEISTTKFAGSVEVQILLNLNEKQKKDAIRGSFSLPNKFGKEIKVLVFTESAKKEDLADADHAGSTELMEKVEKGTVEYDVVIATPEMMPKIAKLGKILGTKGLMPNPKNGTVTVNVKKSIADFKSGMKNFKMKETGKINVVIGKTDMGSDKLVENFEAFYKSLSNELRKYGSQIVKSIKVAPTMGPVISMALIAEQAE